MSQYENFIGRAMVNQYRNHLSNQYRGTSHYQNLIAQHSQVATGFSYDLAASFLAHKDEWFSSVLQNWLNVMLDQEIGI